MGFNVQGIATSKKFESNEKLAGALGLGTIQKVGDTYFGNASSSHHMDEGDIFFTEMQNGTLLTLGTEFEIDMIPLKDVSKNGKAIRFIISETAMAFVFEYFEDGENLRSVWHAEGENKLEEGEPLNIEQRKTDLTEIIFGLIGEVTGTTFHQIESDLKSEHYRLL